MPEEGFIMVETVEPEETGTVYEILGPGGPNQSICDEKNECVVDLTKRSSTTQGIVCGKLKLEGPKPRSVGATGFMNEELSDGKEGVLVMLLKDVETEKMGIV